MEPNLIYTFDDGFSQDNVYYNYYSIKEMKDVLLLCQLIKTYNAPDVICSTIANYVGTADWSSTDKSPNIKIGILDKNHRAIKNNITQCSYHAILSNVENCLYDTILLNDWIDTIESIKQGLIYRYNFEFFQPIWDNSPLQPISKNLCIGLITSKKLKNNNDKFFANNDSSIGNDFYGHSLAWKLPCNTFQWRNSRISNHKFLFRYNQMLKTYGGCSRMNWDFFDGDKLYKKKSDTTKKNAISIEINFATKRFNVKCTAFVDTSYNVSGMAVPGTQDFTHLLACRIPNKLLKHELPMKIAVSFGHDGIKQSSKLYTESTYSAVGIRS